MNAKKAKRLRRLAESLTVGSNERNLVVGSVTTKPVLNRVNGAITIVNVETMINEMGTTREVYRDLKKDQKHMRFDPLLIL